METPWKPGTAQTHLPGPCRGSERLGLFLLEESDTTIAARPPTRMAGGRAFPLPPEAAVLSPRTRSTDPPRSPWKRDGNDRVQPGEKRRQGGRRCDAEDPHGYAASVARRKPLKRFGHTCHAGGRGFESRRSRKSTCKSPSFVAARPPAFLASRTDPARKSTGNPRTEPAGAANPRKRTTGPPDRRSFTRRMQPSSVFRAMCEALYDDDAHGNTVNANALAKHCKRRLQQGDRGSTRRTRQLYGLTHPHPWLRREFVLESRRGLPTRTRSDAHSSPSSASLPSPVPNASAVTREARRVCRSPVAGLVSRTGSNSRARAGCRGAVAQRRV
jgi:hypothetical protein